MTPRALLGIALLCALFLGAGTAILAAARPTFGPRDLARLAGLAYLLGLAALGLLWTLALVAGIPFGLPVILGAAGLVIAAGLLVARLRGGRSRPGGGTASLGLLVLVPALGIAYLGYLAEILFGAARLQPLTAFDAWAFWVAKAKVVYYTGGLDEQFFTRLTNPNYPPLLPIVDAAAFHLMGSADVVTLHVLHWAVAVAFVWALAGMLTPHVPAWLLWPFVVLLVVTPRIVSRVLVPEADLLLQFLAVAAVVLVALWLRDREDWRLVLATLLLAGVVVTKREGTALAAVVLLSATVASVGRLRWALPRLGLAAAAVVVAGIPWRLWYAAHGVGSEAPLGVGTDLDRARDSLRLSYDALFDASSWNVSPTLALLAVAIAVVFGSRRLACFQGMVLAGFFLAGAFATYAYPELKISTNPGANPILRLTGAFVVAGMAVAPLLLATVWERHGLAFRVGVEHPGRLTRRRVALGVAVLLLVYPAVTLAKGGPRFPSVEDCARVAHSDADGELELVFAHLDSPVAAQELLDRVLGAGFVGTEVRPDGCGRWKVTNDGIDSFEQGQGTIEEARKVGFDPRLEVDPG